MQRLLVHIKIEIPKEFTKKQEECLLRAMKRERKWCGHVGKDSQGCRSAQNLWIGEGKEKDKKEEAKEEPKEDTDDEAEQKKTETGAQRADE